MITQPISDIETLQSDGLSYYEAMVPMFKALSSPVRLQILALLLAHGDTLCQKEIEGALGWVREQPTISHHIRVLRESGLIERTHKGRSKGVGSANALYQYHRIRPGAYCRVEAVARQVLLVAVPTTFEVAARNDIIEDQMSQGSRRQEPLHISGADMRHAVLNSFYDDEMEGE